MAWRRLLLIVPLPAAIDHGSYRLVELGVRREQNEHVSGRTSPTRPAFGLLCAANYSPTDNGDFLTTDIILLDERQAILHAFH